MADLQRRVLALETVQRVGINRVITAWGTASASPTVFGAAEYGAAGTTWESSDGSSGTGYAQVTIDVRSSVLIIVGGRMSSIGWDSGVAWRSQGGTVGVETDGLFGTGGYPDIRRQILNRNPEYITAAVSIVVTKTFTPGIRTFRVGANWQNDFPAAPVQPLLSDVTLTVIPID